MKISAGIWRQRDGSRVEVVRRGVAHPPLSLEERIYFWIGRCECGEIRTWDDFGQYSPVAEGPFDLVEPLPEAKMDTPDQEPEGSATLGRTQLPAEETP